eukprot:1195595-Prorocentrum_minimum.AAC.1
MARRGACRGGLSGGPAGGPARVTRQGMREAGWRGSEGGIRSKGFAFCVAQSARPEGECGRRNPISWVHGSEGVVRTPVCAASFYPGAFFLPWAVISAHLCERRVVDERDEDGLPAGKLLPALQSHLEDDHLVGVHDAGALVLVVKVAECKLVPDAKGRDQHAPEGHGGRDANGAVLRGGTPEFAETDGRVSGVLSAPLPLLAQEDP